MKSAAVKAGGGGVLAGCCPPEAEAAAAAEWPPWGEGSCDVEAMSPTATHVEHDLDKENDELRNSFYNANEIFSVGLLL